MFKFFFFHFTAFILLVFDLTISFNFRLGEFMQNIRKDFNKASEHFKFGCETYNNSLCCYRLGQSHQLGRGGVAKDQLKASECYKKACDSPTTDELAKNQRIGDAWGSLGFMPINDHDKKITQHLYKNEGSGDVSTPDMTYANFKRSCELDNVIGCNLLSQFCMSGFPDGGVLTKEKDFVQGAKWAEKACMLGNAGAC